MKCMENRVTRTQPFLRPYLASLLILGAGLLSGIASAATVTLVDVDLDGEADEVRVETDLYSGTCDLTRNGMFKQLVYKPTNTDFSGSKYYTRYYYPGNDWVMPGDPETGFRPDNEQEKQASRMMLTARTEQPDEHTVRVVMEGYCADLFGLDWYSDLFVQRVVTFRDGRRTIEFEYTVTNGNDRPRAVYVIFDHGIDCRNQDAEAYVPRRYGISMQSNASRSSQHKNLDHQQANCWGVLKRDGTGAIETFDGTWTDRAYVHAKSNAGLGMHQELRPRSLAPGKSQTWRYTLAGLHGLNSLQGAAPGIILGLEFREDAKPGVWKADQPRPGKPVPVRARLLSDTDRHVTVELRHLDGDAGKELTAQSLTVALRAHRPTLAEFPPVAAADGFNVFHVAVREGNSELFRCHESFDASGKDRQWAPESLNPQPWKGDRVAWKKEAKPPARPLPSPDLSVTTEHTSWARPSSSGTAKLLVAFPRNHCEAHIRELMQRGDYELIHCRDGKGLEQGLAEADVAFIAGINIAKGKEGEANRKAVLAAVSRGVGVVVIGGIKTDSDPVSAKRLLRTLEKEGTAQEPPFAARPFAHSASGFLGARCFSHGKGRVVVVPRDAKGYRDALEPVVHNEQPRYADGNRKATPHYGLYRGFEYTYQSLIGLVEWTGRRGPELTCDAMLLDGPLGNRRLLMPFRAIEGKPVNGTLHVQLRNLFNEIVAAGRESVSLPTDGSASEVPVALGAVPAGPHVAEWRLTDAQGRVQGFGSQLVSLESDVHVDVSLSRKNAAYRAGETVTAAVAAKASFAAPQVAYSVVDAYGREVARGSISLAVDGHGEIALPVLRNCSELHDLRVSLMDGERIAARTVCTFYIYPESNPMDDDFYVAAWGPMQTGNVAQRQIAAAGARAAGIDYTHLHGDGSSNRDIAYRTHGGLYNLLSKHFRFGSYKYDNETKALTPPIAPDEERVAMMKADWQKQVQEAYTVGGAFYFGLDDERGMHWDQSEGSIRQFRLWLADRYKTVAALNRTWGTTYANWDEVTGTEKVIAYGPETNLAPQVDRDAFLSFVWGHWYMRMPGLWAREVAPGATVGEAGTYGFHYDPAYALGPWFIHTNYYPDGYKSEVYRSTTAPGFEAGPYTGYHMLYNAAGLTAAQRSLPWRTLFQGGQHLSYWELQTTATHSFGVLQYDGLPAPGYRDLARDEWPDLKGGIGKLIIDREFVDSKIGVLHQPRYAEQMKGVIEDVQRQHHIYLASEIETGALERDGVRVLFMSAVRMASDPLLTALDRFVRAGGHLVLVVEQNTRPGELNEHGRRREDVTFFDRLSGVDFSQIRRHAGRGTIRPAAGVAGLADGMLRPTASGLNAVEANILAHVDVRGQEILAWTRRQHGAGVVHVLNATLRDYKRTQSGGVAGETFSTASGPERMVRAVRAIYRSVLDGAGVPPLFQVHYKQGNLAGSECYRFETPHETDGPVVLGFLPEANGEATIELPITAHLYDVRARHYIGDVSTFTESLKAGHAKVWAALPYRVEAVQVEAASGQVRPGTLVRVNAHVMADGRTVPFAHTVRLLLQRREGNSWLDLPAHSCNLSAAPASFSRELPLALNAPPGRYRVCVRDVLSGTVGTREFEVLGE